MWTVPPARSGPDPAARPSRGSDRGDGLLAFSWRQLRAATAIAVHGVRDLLVVFVGRVLGKGQRRLRRGVTHPVHEVLEARAGTRREGVGGVAQVVRCQDVRRASRTAEAVNGRPRSPWPASLRFGSLSDSA